MAKKTKKMTVGGIEIDGVESPEVNLPGWYVQELDYPTFRITLIAKIMDRLTTRFLAKRGDLTYAEWRVLARLGTQKDGLTVGKIAELAWADRAEVSRAASALEERGFTARRENPTDRRKPILFLTEVGEALYRERLAERCAFHEALLADLTTQERQAFDFLLQHVGRKLNDMLDV